MCIVFRLLSADIVHPGSLFTIFLAQRLALDLTTFFQNVPEYVWLSTHVSLKIRRILLIFSDTPWVPSEGPHWALVDSNRRPCPCFIRKRITIFHRGSVITGGVGRKTTGRLDTSTQILSR